MLKKVLRFFGRSNKVIARFLFLLLALLAGLAGIVWCLLYFFFFRINDIPHGEIGPRAHLLAQNISKRIGLDHFLLLDAFEFEVLEQNALYFKRKHFVDQKRKLYETRLYTRNNDYRVQFNTKENYLIYKNGERWAYHLAFRLNNSQNTNNEKNFKKDLKKDFKKNLKKAKKIYNIASQKFKQDLLLVHPFYFLKTEETQLKYIGEQALLMELPQRQIYLFITDSDLLPTRMQIWKANQLIQGLEWQIEKWTPFLSDTIWMSLKRRNKMQSFLLEESKFYSKYPLENNDTFSLFLKKSSSQKRQKK